jgi:FkbM family methyltransferase
MSLRQGFHLYYDLFGAAGLFLAARSRLSGRKMEVATGVPGVLHPVRLRVRTTDIGMCHEILIKRCYRNDLPAAPEVIIDAGANIGLTSIFFANEYPNARIIAIEPEASNFEMLQKNTAPYRNVEIINAALWGENRELNIFDPQEGHTAFRTKSESPAGAAGPKKVRGVTLDRLMLELGIDFVDLLKIDIEGAELEVFADPERWIDRVGIIAIELHERLRPGCEASVNRATKDFKMREQSGETTYFAKRSFGSRAASNPRQGGSAPVQPKIPLKILSVS